MSSQENKGEAMKKISLVFGIIVFIAMTSIVLIQWMFLVRARHTIEFLNAENEALKRKNADVLSIIGERQGLISRLRAQAAINEEDIAKVKKENNELLKKQEDGTKEAEKNSTPGVTETDVSALANNESEEEGDTKETKGGAEPANQMREYLESMLSNPEMKDLMRQSLRTASDMMLKDLFDSLNLSAEDLTKFKEMLVDKQILGMEMGLAMMKETANEEDKKKIEEEMKAKIAKLDDDIRMLIGESGYEEYEDYSNSIADRMALNQYKKRLESSGVASLEARQEQELLLALSEEKKNFTFSSQFASESNFDFDRFTEENLQTYIKERQQFAERMIERSKTILVEQQWEQYKASIESQLKMEKMQMEMAIKLFGNKSNVNKKTTDSEGTQAGDEQNKNEEDHKEGDSSDTEPSEA